MSGRRCPGLAAKGLGFAALYPDGDEDRKPTPNLAPVLAAAEADERFLGRPTRLGVLRALVAVARRSGRLDVHPGVRDLAAAAGVSEGTVKRSLADLKKWGFVTAGAGAPEAVGSRHVGAETGSCICGPQHHT